MRPGGAPIEVTLREGLVIEGRFASGGGSGAYVYALRKDGVSVNGKVAADGSFSFRGVPPGTYDLHGSAGGTTYGPVSVEAGRKDLVLGDR